MRTVRFRRWFLRISAALMLAFVLACGSRHPLGIPDDQWQMMSLEEQNKTRLQQAELDRAAAEERAARARLRAAEAEARKAELEALRQNAPYGDRVQCVFEGGQAYLNRNWHPVSAFGLDLVRGYEEEFTMEVASGRYSRMPVMGYALYDGQTITLCRLPREDTYRHEDCLRLVGTRRELQRGLDNFVSASEFLRGRLRCDLPPSGEWRKNSHASYELSLLYHSTMVNRFVRETSSPDLLTSYGARPQESELMARQALIRSGRYLPGQEIVAEGWPPRVVQEPGSDVSLP